MPSILRAWQIPAGVLAIVALALAAASIEQHAVGWNELSHYAQARAFASGTPRIDRWHHTTGDRAFFEGHWYSDKAPGLALFVLPAFYVVNSLHLVSQSYGMVHLLVLVGCTLPFLVIMLLAYRLVERRDRGSGAVVAMMLGAGTILLPFATMLFSHVLSACLGFAAFCLLLHERERRRERGTRDGLGLIAAAGLLCGYAIGSEFPLAILVALLGLYVAWRPAPLRALVSFAGGVLIGLIPLLAYNMWAFGSPLHLSYESVAANSSGFLGLGAPSFNAAVKLLLADRGLLIVTPVCAAAIGGIAVLYREGERELAIVSGAVAAAYFVYNLCYYLPFGGSVPGPRFMITMLPFLALPLAAAYRRAPITTLALGAISAATMIAATVTLPILSIFSSTDQWWRMLLRGTFTTRGITIYLFGAFLVVALALLARATPRPALSRRDLQLTVVAVGSWFALRHAGPALLVHDDVTHSAWGAVTLIMLAAAVATISTFVALGRAHAWLAALPVLAVTLRSLDHTTLALGVAAVSLALLAVLAHGDPALPSGPKMSG